MKTALEVAKEMYAALLDGDFPKVHDMLHDDCVVEFFGPNTIPYAGRFVGKEVAKKFFSHVENDVLIHTFTQEEFIASETQVAVYGHLCLTAKVTGRKYDTKYVHIIDVKDEKWVRFRDFADTATVAHAFLVTDTPARI